MRCKTHEQENCSTCFPPINPETGVPYLDRPTGHGPSAFIPPRECCGGTRKCRPDCPEAIRRREERAAREANKCPGCGSYPDQDHLDGCTGVAPAPGVTQAVEIAKTLGMSVNAGTGPSAGCGCPLGREHRADCSYMADWREADPESYAELQSQQAKALGAAVGQLFAHLTGTMADPETGVEVLASLTGKRHRVVDLDIAGHKLARAASLPDGSTLKVELRIQRQWPVDPAEVEAANKVNY